jgi:hypothetical protein
VVKSASSDSEDESEAAGADKKRSSRGRNSISGKRYTGGTIYVPTNPVPEAETEKQAPAIPDEANAPSTSDPISADAEATTEIAEASESTEPTESAESPSGGVADVRRSSRRRGRRGGRGAKNTHSVVATPQINTNAEVTAPSPQEHAPVQKDTGTESKKVFTLNIKKKRAESFGDAANAAPAAVANVPEPSSEKKKSRGGRSRSKRHAAANAAAKNDNTPEKIETAAVQDSSENIFIAPGAPDNPKKDGIVAGFVVSEKHKVLTQFVESYFNYERNFERQIVPEDIVGSPKKKSRSGWWKKLIKKPDSSSHE